MEVSTILSGSDTKPQTLNTKPLVWRPLVKRHEGSKKNPKPLPRPPALQMASLLALGQFYLMREALPKLYGL